MAMMSFAWGLIGVVLLIIIAPVMQAIARRAASSIPPVIILAIAAVISHGASVLLGVAAMPHLQYWNAASIFSFGAMLYVFAFGAVYKSVSLEILLDLGGRPNRQAPLADIVERHVPDIFRGRTDILVEGGQVERAGSLFVVTVSGRKLADQIARIRRAFAIGDTGLYDFPASPPKSDQIPGL
jgi:Ca2+/Na+ antiporter